MKMQKIVYRMVFALLVAATAQAQTTYVRQNNANLLNTTNAWGLTTSPTGADIVKWDSTCGSNVGTALGGSVTWGQIQIVNPVSAISIGGTAGAVLTLNGVSGVGVDMSAATQNLTMSANPVALGGDQTWAIASGRTLTTGSNATGITNGVYQLTVDVAGTATFGTLNQTTGTSLVGSGALVKNGTGRLEIGNNNSAVFSGNITVNGGTLFYGDSTGALGAGNINIVNGIIESRWDGSISRAQGTTGTTIQITGGISGFTTSRNNTFNIGNITWGSSTFNPSEFVLQGTVTLSNVINLNGSDRTVRANQGAGTISGVISNGGGTAGLIKVGVGTIVLSAANTYNGTTTVSNGVLRLNHATALPGGINATGGTSALTLDGGVVELANGNFLRNLGTGSAQFQILGGVSGFSANGAVRNVIINNTVSQEIQWGSATFNPSTLVLNAATANNVLNFQNKLDLNGATRTIAVNANTATISNDIRTASGTAIGLTKSGGGTLVLAGNNSYDGTTTISGGMISVGTSASLGVAGTGIAFDGGGIQVTGTSLNNFSGRSVSYTSGKSVTFDISNSANTFTLDQTMNLGTGSLAKFGTGSLVLSNAAFTSSGVLLAAGSMRVFGDASTPTTWDLGNAAIQYGTNTSSLAMIVNGGGTVGGAVITNVNQMLIGYTSVSTAGANNNSFSLTNGVRLFSTNAITVGYADGVNSNVATNNSLTITGGAAGSILNARGGNLIVGQAGYGNTANTGAALNNRLLIGAGGIVTNANLIVGYGTKYMGQASSTMRADNNVATVIDGGKIYSSGSSYIGYNTHADTRTRTNAVVITGANSLWDLGGARLFVGRATLGASTDNALMVSAGGMATNISALIVSGANTLSLGAGGIITAGVVTNSGTLAVTIDGSQTPACGRLNVSGELNLNNTTLDVTVGTTPTEPCVIATYGSLTGGFAVTNGLSDKYRLDTRYKGNQIAVVYTAAGTLIQIR